MIIRRRNGFTLVEIMVVIAILGILAASAVPTYRTWHARALGTEAKAMARQIMDAQIVYFMDNNKFYPDGTTIEIFSDDPEDSPNVLNVASNLNIVVPTGHFLDYSFQPIGIPPDEQFSLQISSSSGARIFKGASLLIYTINKKGEIEESFME